MVGACYPVVWTPGFTEDVAQAVEYIAKVLKAPAAARALFDGVNAQLENVRAMPMAAVVREGLRGERFYVLSYKHYNIYYTFEQETIKAVGLKHQLQGWAGIP